MASLRTMFLGVQASNGVVKALFLPLCYVALLSPFTLAAAWYFGLEQVIENYSPEELSLYDILPPIALTTVFILLPTRLLSVSGDAAKSKDGVTSKVQSLPYWIPGIRNLGSIIFGGEKWLKSVRDSSVANVVAYKAAGTKHNILFSESVLKQLLEQWSSLEEPQGSKWAVLQNAFSIPDHAESQYFELAPAIASIVETEMFKGKQLEALVKASLNNLSETLPDFITFNSSIVDQMQWERVSNVELTDGTSEVECDLLMLLNEYCCNAILPPIMGMQFTESYQLLATDLATFNQRFWALALGLPRLSPIQGLPGAALAQKRLLQNFRKLFDDITNPPVRRVPADDESVSGDEDTDADVATPLTKLNELFTKHELTMDVRAAIALQLVHGVVAEVVPLVFWTIIYVYSSSSAQDTQIATEAPLGKIKVETRVWAQAIQPPSIHPSFPAPPEIRYISASEAITPKSFPFLWSCIQEARRLNNCSVSTYKITKPIVLEEAGISQPGEQERWELDVGSYVDVGLSQSLINSSLANHISAPTFKADRFVNTGAPLSIVSPTDTSEPYKTALLVALVAGIVQLWEISPAPKKSFFDHMQEAGAEASIGAAALTGEQKAAKEEAKHEKDIKDKKMGKWVLPAAMDGASVKIPKGDVRVRIRRREGLPASKIVRRIG